MNLHTMTLVQYLKGMMYFLPDFSLCETTKYYCRDLTLYVEGQGSDFLVSLYHIYKTLKLGIFQFQ